MRSRRDWWAPFLIVALVFLVAVGVAWSIGWPGMSCVTQEHVCIAMRSRR